MFSLDGNFRHKHKDVSSDAADPGLGTGWAYFVDDRAYKEYIRQHANDAEQVSRQQHWSQPQ